MPPEHAKPDATAPAAGGAPAELTVTQVTRRVKELVEGAGDLSGIWVKGEVSNVRLAGSGHLYFTLKDAQAQLRAAYFNFGRGKRKPPEDGAAVLAHGDVRVYERGGEYQLIADDLIKAGIGDLAAQFEALKQRLAAAGMFDEARKVALPSIPRCVAVVTGIATAALQDVLQVLRRRAPYLRTIVFPTAVQGDAAVPEIISALQAADAHPDVELILLVRGGGSLEDLWCFNSEQLAAALATIERPVMTGIGHEIDFTIADFIADHRAPTPSAAAEQAAPDAADLAALLGQQRLRLSRAPARRLQDAQAALGRLFDRRAIRDVLGRIKDAQQDVDQAATRLVDAVLERTFLADAAAGQVYDVLLGRLAAPVQQRLADGRRQVAHREDDLLRAGRARLQLAQSSLAAISARLQGLDPRAPKRLGFALVWGADGKLVRDPQDVALGERLRIEVRDGELHAKRE